tara:strand:+ start:367 stop:510 length:144 start_codon:yes stop_codon:yes gene_type:complete
LLNSQRKKSQKGNSDTGGQGSPAKVDGSKPKSRYKVTFMDEVSNDES